MESNGLQVILLAIIGIFGGKEIWKFLSDRHKAKMANANIGRVGENELQKEVRELFEQKAELMKKQMTSLEERMLKIEKERDECKEEMGEMSTKIAVLTERLLKYTQKSRGNKKE
jgi:hypothetical protein